jgi:hypothetical protein
MTKPLYLLFLLIFSCCNSIDAQLICFDFPADTIYSPDCPIHVTSADFNGDGFDDLAVSQFNAESFNILLNDGRGYFEESTVISMYSNSIILADDINHDDIVDLIVFGDFYDIFIFIGNGDGTFTEIPWIFTDFWGSAGGETGYFNEDEHVDFVIVDYIYGEQMCVYLGDGEGSFQMTGYKYYTFGVYPLDMAKNDFNEDGFSDIVIVNQGTQDNTDFCTVLLTGKGNGLFNPAVIIEDQYIPQTVVAGDFNQDRHIDVIFKRYDRWLVKLWGNGDGTFQEPELEDISAIYYAHFLQEVDINSDGALDLAMNHHYFNMEINDGEGNFADTFYINEKSNHQRVMALATGYFNGDTLPDIVTTHMEPGNLDYGSITVYFNCFFTGVTDVKPFQPEINLYPNPGQGIFKISSNCSESDLIVAGIFSIKGAKIEEELWCYSSGNLDLTSLKNGLYLVQFGTGRETFIRKVLINR